MTTIPIRPRYLAMVADLNDEIDGSYGFTHGILDTEEWRFAKYSEVLTSRSYLELVTNRLNEGDTSVPVSWRVEPPEAWGIERCLYHADSRVLFL